VFGNQAMTYNNRERRRRWVESRLLDLIKVPVFARLEFAPSTRPQHEKTQLRLLSYSANDAEHTPAQ